MRQVGIDSYWLKANSGGRCELRLNAYGLTFYLKKLIRLDNLSGDCGSGHDVRRREVKFAGPRAGTTPRGVRTMDSLSYSR